MKHQQQYTTTTPNRSRHTSHRHQQQKSMHNVIVTHFPLFSDNTQHFYCISYFIIVLADDVSIMKGLGNYSRCNNNNNGSKDQTIFHAPWRKKYDAF